MYDILVTHDDGVTLQEQRMFEVAIKEAAGLFPNCNILLIRSEEEYPISEILESARTDRDGRTNAVDVLKHISTAEGVYTLLFTTDEIYIEWVELKVSAPCNYNVFNVVSENAAVCSIATLGAELSIEEEMYVINHTVCNLIAQIVFGLKQSCTTKNCMMKTIKNDNDLLELVKNEQHGLLRVCNKCRDKIVECISCYGELLTPSHTEIIDE